MRDFVSHEHDAADQQAAAPDPAPATKATRHIDATRNLTGHEPGIDNIGGEMSDDMHAGRAYLSHPANAEPLAELLSELQQTHGNAYVQRIVAGMREAKAGEAEAHGDSARPLDAPVRALMEAGFEENFGDVRVHTGERAEQSADLFGARAFTQGQDVYFGRGGFDPSSREDRETLAHELAHIAQQRVRRDEQTATTTREGAEREADEAARLVVAGQRAQVSQTADASSIYMQTTPPAQRPPAPTPAPPPPAALNLNVPVISDAIVRLLTERAYENERINLWASLPSHRWRWIAQYFMLLFPAAMSALLNQRPARVSRLDFLQTACTQIWNMLQAPLVGIIEQRREREKQFRDRTDRERQRMMTGDISAPADDEL